ncbi:hypothetical protein SUDANB95_05528 [Actinosynnema sp. ALI-1.44]
MDAVLTAVLQNVPQMGLGGVAVMFIVLLMRREASAEERHQAELNRITKAHDDELAELRADIAALRKQVDDVNTALDLEREQRRKAEDDLATALRRQGGAVR